MMEMCVVVRGFHLGSWEEQNVLREKEQVVSIQAAASNESNPQLVTYDTPTYAHTHTPI